MKITDIIAASPRHNILESTKGREFNHLEDLILFYGSEGAIRSIETLVSFESSQEDLSVKWDGKLALYYGRLPDGKFALGTIGNWNKHTPQTSKEGIYDYITSGGNNEDWRQNMAISLARCFDILDDSVPRNFRGFIKGDVIFAPVMAPVKQTSEGLTFTSNQVTYVVDPRSPLGKRVSTTLIGIAVHVVYPEWGSKDSTVIQQSQISQFNSNSVLAIGQTYAQHNPSVDIKGLDEVRALVQRHRQSIDSILPGRPGLADMGAILYKYQNQTSRSGDLDDIHLDHFNDWLQASSVSNAKKEKINNIQQEMPDVFPAIFEIVRWLQTIKNSVIEQLDNTNNTVKAYTNGQKGGEGYVSLKSKTKLVPRHIWKPK